MLPSSPVVFMAGYVRRRWVQFGGLALLVSGATCCAVAAQYGMKLIVDEMAIGDRHSSRIWHSFALFLGLIATESVLSRLAGWLGCRVIVRTGVDVRLDLFRHLSGHPMQFFAGHLSGALGARITSTTGALAGALGGLAWHIVPRASTSSARSWSC